MPKCEVAEGLRFCAAVGVSADVPVFSSTSLMCAGSWRYGLGDLVVRVLTPKDQQMSTILPADPGSRISLCARAASASGTSLLTTGRRVPFSKPAKSPA
jgi:hypothetical protein